MAKTIYIISLKNQRICNSFIIYIYLYLLLKQSASVLTISDQSELAREKKYAQHNRRRIHPHTTSWLNDNDPNINITINTKSGRARTCLSVSWVRSTFERYKRWSLQLYAIGRVMMVTWCTEKNTLWVYMVGFGSIVCSQNSLSGVCVCVWVCVCMEC